RTSRELQPSPSSGPRPLHPLESQLQPALGMGRPTRGSLQELRVLRGLGDRFLLALDEESRVPVLIDRPDSLAMLLVDRHRNPTFSLRIHQGECRRAVRIGTQMEGHFAAVLVIAHESNRSTL